MSTGAYVNHGPTTGAGAGSGPKAVTPAQLDAMAGGKGTIDTEGVSPAQRPNGRTIGHYVLGKTLGQGTFGKVKIATHTLTGERVAIKILQKDKIQSPSDVERISREIHILKMMRHPHVIQLYEIIETPRHLFLVMEHSSGGELFDYIVANSRVAEAEACRFFQQIISGVEYIHRVRVVHRDMKPENLLIDTSKNIKIVDFGLSNTYKEGELLKTACGSPCYAAPEMIAGKKYVGVEVDIWSCGVILFALLAGYLPFEDSDTTILYKKIMSGDYAIPRFLSPEAKDLIRRILTVDPAKRFKIEDIRRHPWWSLYTPKRIPMGIMTRDDFVPVDPTLAKEMKTFGFDPIFVAKCVENNKHNSITTTYYLTMKKYLAGGVHSSADLNSDRFEHSLIQSKNKPRSITPNHAEQRTASVSGTRGASTNPRGLVKDQADRGSRKKTLPAIEKGTIHREAGTIEMLLGNNAAPMKIDGFEDYVVTTPHRDKVISFESRNEKQSTAATKGSRFQFEDSKVRTLETKAAAYGPDGQLLNSPGKSSKPNSPRRVNDGQNEAGGRSPRMNDSLFRVEIIPKVELPHREKAATLVPPPVSGGKNSIAINTNIIIDMGTGRDRTPNRHPQSTTRAGNPIGMEIKNRFDISIYNDFLVSSAGPAEKQRSRRAIQGANTTKNARGGDFSGIRGAVLNQTLMGIAPSINRRQSIGIGGNGMMETLPQPPGDGKKNAGATYRSRIMMAQILRGRAPRIQGEGEFDDSRIEADVLNATYLNESLHYGTRENRSVSNSRAYRKTTKDTLNMTQYPASTTGKNSVFSGGASNRVRQRVKTTIESNALYE